MRESLIKFAVIMEKKLKRNDHKGGWVGEDIDYLLDRLDEEVVELRKAIEKEHIGKRIKNEAADVANFAMMIADNYEE